VVRGGVPVVLAGSVTSAGDGSVTGSGTAFLSNLHAGDIIAAANADPESGRRVVSVSSDTLLHIESPPASPWRGVPFARLDDRLLQTPAVVIDEVRDASRVYASAFALQPDFMSVRWSDATLSPAPGARYSVRYRYLPRYTLVPGLGAPGRVVGGVQMPTMHRLRLLQPGTFEPNTR
jgi:hypothetical protein